MKMREGVRKRQERDRIGSEETEKIRSNSNSRRKEDRKQIRIREIFCFSLKVQEQE